MKPPAFHMPPLYFWLLALTSLPPPFLPKLLIRSCHSGTTVSTCHGGTRAQCDAEWQGFIWKSSSAWTLGLCLFFPHFDRAGRKKAGKEEVIDWVWNKWNGVKTNGETGMKMKILILIVSVSGLSHWQGAVMVPVPETNFELANAFILEENVDFLTAYKTWSVLAQPSTFLIKFPSSLWFGK